MEETEPYLYKKRYYSIEERFENWKFDFKYSIQRYLLSNRLTTKLLHPLDRYTFNRRKKIGRYNIKNRLSDGIKSEYADINILEISYIEAIEIDDFDKYRNKIISKLGTNQGFPFSRSKDELREQLADVKDKLDSISRGNLFAINYEKNRNPDNNLINYADISYIKTYESYFILQIRVKPSGKFKEIFQEIVSQQDNGLSKSSFKNFKNIIKTRRFGSHESFQPSLKYTNIRNLISDLNQQVKLNITSNFKGHFYNSKKYRYLPSIECYEVKNMDSFNLDTNLKQNFRNRFDNFYSLKDNQIEIHIADSDSKNQALIQIIKQHGHGSKEKSEKDLTNYDDLETYYLNYSLVFPCFFKAIMREQFEILNRLKREIYDFVQSSRKGNFISNFFFIKQHKKYLRLKQQLTQILLTIKRSENEFTEQTLSWYTDGEDLAQFEARNERDRSDKLNLKRRFIEEFKSSVSNLERKTTKTNEIFKMIEELNSYKTNFLLQMTSLFIAILALIFTFGKTKLLIIELWNSIKNI